MKYLLCSLFCCLLYSRGQQVQNAKQSANGNVDTVIHIIWRDSKTDTVGSGPNSTKTSTINVTYCKNAPESIKAAIGYVGSLIDDCLRESNSRSSDVAKDNWCLIPSLGLEYSYSKIHLTLLRKWLKNEPKLFKRIDSNGIRFSNIEEHFDKMDLRIISDALVIDFETSGINTHIPNTRLEKSWTRGGSYIFKVSETELHLLAQQIRKPEYSSLGDGS